MSELSPSFFVRKDGRESGPYSLNQLREMAASGTLGFEDEVQRAGGTGWRPAGKISGLSASTASVPSPYVGQPLPVASQFVPQDPVHVPASPIPQPPAPPLVPFPQTAYAPPVYHPVQVNVNAATPRSTNSLGIASLVVGVLALLGCWIPFLSVLLGGLGFLLGVGGLVVSATRKGGGIGFSIAGTVLSLPALVVGVPVTLAVITLTDRLSKSGSSSGPPSSAIAPTSTRSNEKALYIKDSIDLYDFSAQYHEAVLDGRVPGVEFKLRNRGNRTLNEVKVIVYFKDARGNIIAEEDYHPVLVSSSRFSLRDNKPLKPGYIWQMERGKFYAAKNVPSEWKEGSAEAKVTDIEFAEEGR